MIARAAIALVLAAVLAGCATTPAPSCSAGTNAAEIAGLYFGRNIGPALGVSDADWQKFVDEEVTPRFPNGLSVTDVSGQWRGDNGQIVREPSKALMLVLSGEADEPAKLEAIRAAYKARFRQEAVMLIRRTACVGF